VVSGALVAAVQRENADVTRLDELTPRGPLTRRGRDTPIEVWVV
jgi:hypothetical protein